MEYSNLFVVLMGIGTVFVGLICIIVLITIMSAICRKTEKAPAPVENAVPAAPAPVVTPEIVAAVSAAIAEELGTDITAIRIISMKAM